MPSSRGIFPTQGPNPDLLQCGQILYPLSYRECMRTQNIWGMVLIQLTFPATKLSCKKRKDSISFCSEDTNSTILKNFSKH